VRSDETIEGDVGEDAVDECALDQVTPPLTRCPGTRCVASQSVPALLMVRKRTEPLSRGSI
jgi:hypothetical protein